MRVAIIGNSGSGKSTLAKRLRDRHGIAHLDLDAIVWEPGQVAVQRDGEAMREDLQHFVERHQDWVVEGCYGELIDAVLAHAPRLLFLNPGVEVCLDNNRRRPWEPHKYGSRDLQDSMLEHLLDWVRGYYQRADDWSLAAHRRLFDGYDGNKSEFDGQVELSAF